MSTLDESIIVIEDADTKLKRLGKLEVVTGASASGTVPIMDVTYSASNYKRQQRFDITQEDPVDVGQGFQFTNLDNTEV